MGIENVDYGVAARWNEATRAKEREESQVERKPFDISGCIESTEKAIAEVSEVYQEYHIKELYDARVSLEGALRSWKQLPTPLKELDNV